MGQRGALCAVDESVHGHVARPGHTYGQELPQSQSRRSAQHPDPRVLPGAAGEFLSENVVSWPSSFADWTFFFFFSPLPLVSTEKSPRAPERHPQLSDVSRCHRCAHPDSAQQYRETGKSLIGETKPELRVYLLFMDDMNGETSADLPVPQRRWVSLEEEKKKNNPILFLF